jgi:hypothetical protein
MKRVLVLVAMAAALVACEDSGGSKPGETAIADADLAVPADFVDEAEKSISTANYKAELDLLEKEIDAPQ